MRAKDLANWIKYYKQEYNLSGKFDLAEISKAFNISDEETAYILITMFVILHDESVELRRQYELMEERTKAAEAALKEAFPNSNHRQTSLVRNGLKVRKNKMTLTDLKLVMKLNYTDREIMDYFQISKSTLWRRKKELEEEQKLKQKNRGRTKGNGRR